MKESVIKLVLDNNWADLNKYVESTAAKKIKSKIDQKKTDIVKAINEGSDQYKSDDDIEAEFDNMKIVDIELTVKDKYASGYITIEFPEAGEHVGGGASEVVDSFMFYNYHEYKKSGDRPKIAFDNWYPSNVSRELIDAILKYDKKHDTFV